MEKDLLELGRIAANDAEHDDDRSRVVCMDTVDDVATFTQLDSSIASSPSIEKSPGQKDDRQELFINSVTHSKWVRQFSQ